MSVCSAYEKSILIGTAVFLFLYFVMMDIFLYQRFMRVNLVDEKLKNGEMLTVFRPLSVKMIMNDHVTHYLATPLSEALCYYTNFGVNFYYITPNVISFTHLCLGLLSARFVFSESLYRRRIGIVLYEVRSFLDAFDGTVYRSHANDKAYKSDHSNFGYWVDVVSDTLSGFALCFGILFCFWWKCPPRKSQSTSTFYHDSSNKWKINGSHTTIDLPEVKVNRRHDDYTKRYIFWRVFCFGLFWGLASSFWDQLVINYHHVFTTKPGAEHALLQSQLQHSTKTWVIFWCWRILGGQAVLQMVCLAVFIDKTWEFFRFVPYTGLPAAVILFFISNSHVYQIRASLGL